MIGDSCNVERPNPKIATPTLFPKPNPIDNNHLRLEKPKSKFLVSASPLGLAELSAFPSVAAVSCEVWASDWLGSHLLFSNLGPGRCASDFPQSWLHFSFWPKMENSKRTAATATIEAPHSHRHADHQTETTSLAAARRRIPKPKK